MSVTKDDVRKVARLSRIAVPEDKLETLAGELSGIMGWIEQLNEVDIDGVGVDKSALVGFFLCEAGQVASRCGLACLLTRVFRPRKPKELQSCCSLLKYQIFPTQSAASHSGSVLSPQPYTPETFGGCLKPLKPSVLNLVFEASSPQPPNPKLQNPKHIRAQNLNPRPHSKTLQDSSP